MAPKNKKLEIIKKYKISEEDQRILGIKKTYMLSGRVLDTEKDNLNKICKRKKNTQSDEVRQIIEHHIESRDINWDEIKRMKGERLKGVKTDPVRIKVSSTYVDLVSELCEENKVSISSFVRYMVKIYIQNNGVIK